MKALFKKYGHILPVLIYMPIYLIWFMLLERYQASSYRMIRTSLDNEIPFIEIFIIPYFLWFAYVAVAVAIAFLTDKEQYFKSIAFLFIGMTVFLIISTLWPNAQNLRPRIMPRDNIFTRMVSYLYSIDTPTNLWPSIHVYNSIGAYLCIAKCKATKDKKWICNLSLILSILIILSTMFLKQHSTFDVMTAFLMAGIVAIAVYREDVSAFFKEKALEKEKQKDKARKKFV